MNNIKMLCFDRIDVSEGIDVNKTSKSKKCDICHYWYFLIKGLSFNHIYANKCHDLLMMSISLSDVACLNVKGSGYHYIISRISKSEAVKLLQNTDLTEKSGTL